MRRGIVILLFCVMPLAAVAQFGDGWHDARSAAMGGCFLPSMDSAVSMDVGWRQGFMLKGMATRTVAFGMPVGGLGWAGALYSAFGDLDYNEQQLAAGGAMTVAPWLKVMVYGLYSRIGTSDAHYDAQHWLDAGGALTVGGDRVWGYLLAGSRRWSDTRPWMMHGGLAFRPNRQIVSAVGLSVEERLRLRCGMEYCHEGHAFVRAGLCTNPLVLTFGVGYRQRHYHIDIATEVHSTLGVSPQISLGLCL